MKKGHLYKARIPYRLKKYDVVIDQHRPKIICEDNCAKTTAYVYHNSRRGENYESISTELKWEQGTKLNICAEGKNAKKVVEIIAEWLYDNKTIEFNDAKFLSQCMKKFADIRTKYNLSEEVLEQAKKNLY